MPVCLPRLLMSALRSTHDLNQLFYDEVPTVLLAIATSHGFRTALGQGSHFEPDLLW